MAEPRWLIVQRSVDLQTLHFHLVELSRAGVARTLHSDTMTGADSRWGTTPRGSDYILSVQMTRVSDTRAVLFVGSWSPALHAAEPSQFRNDAWIGVVNITGDTFTLGDLYYQYIWTSIEGDELQELDSSRLAAHHVVDGSHVLFGGYERDVSTSDYPDRTEWKVFNIAAATPALAWVYPDRGHSGFMVPFVTLPVGPRCVGSQGGLYRQMMVYTDLDAHTVTTTDVVDPLAADFTSPRAPTSPGHPFNNYVNWVFDAHHWMSTNSVVDDSGKSFKNLTSADGTPSVNAWCELGWVPDPSEDNLGPVIAARGYAWALTELNADASTYRIGLVKIALGAGGTPWDFAATPTTRLILQDNGSGYAINTAAVNRSIADMGNGFAIAWGATAGGTLSNDVWAALVRDSAAVVVPATKFTLPGGACEAASIVAVGTPSSLSAPNGDPKIELPVTALARAAASVTPRVSTEPEPLP